MKLKQYFLLMLLLSLVIGCSNKTDNRADQLPVLTGDTSFYQPPQFMDTDRIEKIRMALAESRAWYEDCATENRLPGVAFGLVAGDSLVFSGGVGSISIESGEPVTTKSLFRIASMTKSFTAMAILQLCDEEKISLSDPVSAHLAELTGQRGPVRDAAPVTIFNLLTMTAGFPEDNPWGDRLLDMEEGSLTDMIREGISFSTAPSTNYEYSNLGYGLLGIIISRVSGIPFQEYITRNILEPLGMNHTIWEYSQANADLLALGYRWEEERWREEPLLHDGAFGSMGGLITSIEDFSKYVSFHLSAWPPRTDPDRGPVKRSTLREMHRMNNPRFWSDPERFGDPAHPIMRGYGFGLVAMKDHEGVIEVGHNGGLPGFGSSYMFYPEYGIGIMAFSNLTYVGGSVRSANYRVIETLIKQNLFHPRMLQVSEILAHRKEQVVQLITTWDGSVEEEIVAANLYQDLSREKRVAEADRVLKAIGEVVSIGPLIPYNQLRGSFTIYGTKGETEVFFTLSPEPGPRVQWLSFHSSFY
ncbi:MAG: serine hydrolase domain-containing protein [Bacteroidota bacterium]